MNSTAKNPNAAYWVITILALLWNLMGVAQFFMQAMNTETFRAQYTEEQLRVIEGLPLYYILIFAVAVFASFLGAVFLIARRKQAISFFTIGLVAVFVQVSYNLLINEAKTSYVFSDYALLVFLPLASIFFWYYANSAKRRGWLR